MNQHLASIFSIVKGEKVYQFTCGNTTVEEVLDVLEDFKLDFILMKKNLEEQEEKRKQESPAVDPEIVSESN